MMPSGSVNIGESRGGVRHPSMHASDRAPRVAGASAETTGRVGDAATLALGAKTSLALALTDDVPGVTSPPNSSSPLPSHAVATIETAAAATKNLRIVDGLALGIFSPFLYGNSFGTRCDKPVRTLRAGYRRREGLIQRTSCPLMSNPARRTAGRITRPR
jgi:hypothetical protein